TQPGSRPNTLSNGENAVLLIQLDGVSASAPAPIVALDLAAGSSVVRGFVINRFFTGILVDSSGNVVTGNFIGPDPTGGVVLANGGDAIAVSGVCCNVIGGSAPADRNVIAGNGSHAVLVSDLGLPPASDLCIVGNFINTDRTGLMRLAGGGTPIAARSA